MRLVYLGIAALAGFIIVAITQTMPSNPTPNTSATPTVSASPSFTIPTPGPIPSGDTEAETE